MATDAHRRRGTVETGSTVSASRNELTKTAHIPALRNECGIASERSEGAARHAFPARYPSFRPLLADLPPPAPPTPGGGGLFEARRQERAGGRGSGERQKKGVSSFSCVALSLLERREKEKTLPRLVYRAAFRPVFRLVIVPLSSWCSCRLVLRACLVSFSFPARPIASCLYRVSVPPSFRFASMPLSCCRTFCLPLACACYRVGCRSFMIR